MADLNNLNAAPNEWDVDFNTLPMGFGAAFSVTPQPGTYKLQLPGREQIEASFEEVDHPEQGKRLRCLFRDDKALTNLTLGGEAYSTMISNVGRKIAIKKGPDAGKSFVVSDMASLLKAVGVIPASNTLQAYKEAMVNAAGHVFLADHILTATCNPKRDVYKYDETQGKSILMAGLKGCGRRFRQEAWDAKGDTTKAIYAIPRDADGKFELRFVCPDCEAEIRAWGALQGFRTAK